jgi:hypothetical protein
VLRITPADGDPWQIALGTPGWRRTPDPSVIAFLSPYSGYLADVVERRVTLEVSGIDRVFEDEIHDLVLFAGGGLVAARRDRIVWESYGSWGDPKVERIQQDAIVCSVYDGTAHRPQVRIDPRDGSLL